jgi:hypothetical protein
MKFFKCVLFSYTFFDFFRGISNVGQLGNGVEGMGKIGDSTDEMASIQYLTFPDGLDVVDLTAYETCNHNI